MGDNVADSRQSSLLGALTMRAGALQTRRRNVGRAERNRGGAGIPRSRKEKRTGDPNELLGTKNGGGILRRRKEKREGEVFDFLGDVRTIRKKRGPSSLNSPVLKEIKTTQHTFFVFTTCKQILGHGSLVLQ